MKCAIPFCIIFISLCFSICQGALRTYYIEDLCFEGYAKDVSLSLRNVQSGILASMPTKSGATECNIRLKPDYGSSVLLSFNAYSLGTEDQLILEDSDGFKIALLGQAEFLNERKSFSSEGTLTIRYIRNDNSTLERRNRLKFRFVFTQYHDYPCDNNEFQCKNQRCIAKNLVCDTHNHCGDNSDQEKCGVRNDRQIVFISGKKSSVWMIIVFVCSGLLAVVIIAFVAVLISSAIKKKKKNNKQGTLPTSAPPTPSAPEMPPSFIGRIRQSFRRPNSNTQTQTASTQSVPEEPKSEKYEVPSMYPQIPASPSCPGVENPGFKSDN